MRGLRKGYRCLVKKGKISALTFNDVFFSFVMAAGNSNHVGRKEIPTPFPKQVSYLAVIITSTVSFPSHNYFYLLVSSPFRRQENVIEKYS